MDDFDYLGNQESRMKELIRRLKANPDFQDSVDEIRRSLSIDPSTLKREYSLALQWELAPLILHLRKEFELDNRWDTFLINYILWGIEDNFTFGPIIRFYEDEVTGKEQPKTDKFLTFGNAAEQILEKHANRQPMHYRTITEKMLDLGLVQSEGQTPAATLYAHVLNEIKRQTRRGETPRFVRFAKGYIGLRKWLGEGLAFQIGRHNDEVRRKLLHQIRTMDWVEFEALVARLLVALGFEGVEITNVSGDGGIDVRGTLVVGDVIQTRMAVQVKRWKKGRNVRAPTVQQVRGSLGTHEQGLIITTSNFSKGAQVEAERADAVPVALMNGVQIVELLIENDIGIHRNSYDLIELGEIDNSDD